MLVAAGAVRRRPDDLPDPREIAAHVKELDRILDECLLAEATPTSDRALLPGEERGS